MDTIYTLLLSCLSVKNACTPSVSSVRSPVRIYEKVLHYFVWFCMGVASWNKPASSASSIFSHLIVKFLIIIEQSFMMIRLRQEGDRYMYMLSLVCGYALHIQPFEVDDISWNAVDDEWMPCSLFGTRLTIRVTSRRNEMRGRLLVRELKWLAICFQCFKLHRSPGMMCICVYIIVLRFTCTFGCFDDI